MFDLGLVPLEQMHFPFPFTTIMFFQEHRLPPLGAPSLQD